MLVRRDPQGGNTGNAGFVRIATRLNNAIFAGVWPLPRRDTLPKRSSHKIDVLGSCEALAAGDEVPNGKPIPMSISLAAERLNRATAQCLAFEDSATGCQAPHMRPA